MITCEIQGKLCNQLIITATAIAYAKRHGFDYACTRPTGGVYGKFYPIEGINYTQHEEKTLYEEPHYHYKAIPKQDNVHLTGLFQSYRYFDVQMLVVNKAFESILSDRAVVSGRIGIHIRRGDYLKFPDCHPVVSAEYIQQAQNHFKTKGFDKFLIFSDDHEWCSANVEGEIVKGDEFEDFKLLSSCQHHIISNSTFGLLAAYLSLNKDNEVVAPKRDRWFGKAYQNYNTKSLYKPNWIEI